MKVKFIATFQELSISTMTEKTWSEFADAEIEFPYDFSCRKLQATIEGTDDEFLANYELTFKNDIKSYNVKSLFGNAIPHQFKDAIRVIAEFKIYKTVLKLVLRNLYGNKNYNKEYFFIESEDDLKSIGMECS